MLKKRPFYGSNLFKTILLKYGKEKKIILQYDPDVDGVMAGHAMWELLTLLNFKVESTINENRNHGILSNDIYNSIIINVDSGISYDQLKTLVDNGNIVVSIDHHEIEYGSYEQDFPNNYKGVLDVEKKEGFLYYENKEKNSVGFVINNQYSFEEFDYYFLSGTGVVLEVLHHIFPEYYKKEHIAWNGITLLSDIRNIENPIARKILEATFSIDIYNETKTLKHLVTSIGENPYAVGKFSFDRTYIDYNFNPVLNAMFRFNLGKDVIRLLRGYKVERLGTIRKDQARVIEELKTRVKKIEFNTFQILSVHKESTDMFEASNFIGYLANKYLETGKSVVIICTEDSKFKRGSFRGVYSDVDYRKVLSDFGLIALGHKVAFGLKTFTSNMNIWKEADKEFDTRERQSNPGYMLHEFLNLKSANKEIRKYAYENQYLLSNHFHCFKYKGVLFSIHRQTEKMIEYKVSGILVTSFDLNLTPKNSFIVPTTSNGFTNLILQKFPTKD